MLNINIWDIVWTVVNLLIFFILLRIFLFKPVMKVMDERKQKIQDDLDSAQAVREIIRHAFEDLGFETLWCGYFDGNEKSRRAQEKCGFTYHHTDKDVYLTLTNDIRTAHVTRLTREEWEKA